MYHHKLAMFFYQVISGFVIIFSLPPSFEYFLYTLAEIQSWSFIISKQLSFTPEYSLDPLTRFIQRLADVISLNELIPESFHLGLLIILSIYSTILEVMVFIGVDYSCHRIIKKVHHKFQGAIGLAHSQVLFFWVNLILTDMNLKTENYGILVCSSLLLIGNSFFGVLGAAYSVSPFLTKAQFASENQNFPLVTFIFRTFLHYFNFVNSAVDYRAPFAILALCMYSIQLIILLSKQPYYKIEAMRFKFVGSSIGFFLSLVFVFHILFLKDLGIGMNEILYVEILLIGITVKISKNICDTICLNYLLKYRQGRIKHSEDVLKIISAIDYFLSPANLKLEPKNSKLVYVMDLIKTENPAEYNQEHKKGVVDITEYQKLSKIKYSKICRILNRAQEIQKVEPLLKVFLAEILLKKFDDFQRASFILEGIRTDNFLETLMIRNLKVKILNKYKMRLAYISESHEIEVFIENENNKEKLIQKILSSISHQQRFLKTLVDSEGEINGLLKHIKQIEKLSHEIIPLRKKLNSFNSQVMEVIPLYAFYLSSVQNFPYSAQQEINEFMRRVETNKQKMHQFNQTKKMVLADPNNIIIKFSMGKKEPGKILQATENIEMLGWELADLLKLNIVKILPEFLGLNEKNFCESFFTLHESYVLSNQAHFGFLANSAGILQPCDVKLYLYPLLADDLIYIAFCRLRSGERYAVADNNRVIAVSQNLIIEMQSVSELRGSVTVPTIQTFHNMMISSPNKMRLQLSVERLRVRHHIDEKQIDVFGKKFNLLTLHPILEGTFHKFHWLKSGTSSSSDPSNVSEGKKILFPKTSDIQKKNRRGSKKSSLNPPSPRGKDKKSISPDKSMFYKAVIGNEVPNPPSMQFTRMMQPQVMLQIETSIPNSNVTKNYRKIQNAVSYTPMSKFSGILGFLNRFLFFLSSILLMTYFFSVKTEFKIINQDIITTQIAIKHIQDIIEIRKFAHGLYFTSLGLLFDNRHSPNSIFDEQSKQFIKEYIDSIHQGPRNFTSNFESYDNSIMDFYFQEVIPIREFSRIDQPQIYFNLPTFISKLIDSASSLVSGNDTFPTNNLDLLYIINNSNDQVLIQLEQIVEAAYTDAINHINYLGDLIGMLTGAISLVGGFNLLILIFVESRTKIKKRYLLTMVSLLDEKEILRVERLLGDFLDAAKRTNPKSLGMVGYERLMDDDAIEYVKKNSKNPMPTSTLKKYGTLNLPIFGILTSFFLLLLLIFFMILPFVIITNSFITSGDEKHIKALIGIHYDTEMNYNKFRQLIAISYDYFAFNGTTTLKNHPIGPQIDQLLTELSLFQPYLVDIKSEFSNTFINFLIYGNLCTYFEGQNCPGIASGAAERGIIGMNSYHLSVFNKLKSEFDASTRSAAHSKMILNEADLISNEQLDARYNAAAYQSLLSAQYDVIQQLIDTEKREMIIILITFFAINLSFGSLLTRGLGAWMVKERESWVMFAKRVPFKIAVNSKIWLAYLNDQTKRDFE